LKRRRFINDISTNSLQLIINQACGFIIFYVLSVYFSKNDFGEINWSLAVLLTSFNILSFGIDQVAIKKIAAGQSPQLILSIYLTHVLLAGGLFYAILLIINLFFPGFQNHYLLLFIGIGKLMIFFSSPFKQLANGLEKFRLLLYMTVCSNIVRSVSLIVFSLFATPDIITIIIIFIAGDVAELVVSVFITKKILKVPLSVKPGKINYLSLLKESLPQAGVVIFTSAIGRFDWIFIGIISTEVILAEYSFAFKIFEVATLPLLIIAPILIPRLTRMFHDISIIPTPKHLNDLSVLLRFEMIIASLVALVLNILWIPVIDSITHFKYGAVNKYTILILSLAMPFLYANNLLWTITFTKGYLRRIFYIFLITFLINVIGDVVLIPFYHGEGAAAAYSVAIFIQFILFWIKTDISKLKKSIYPIILCPLLAFISCVIATLLFQNVYIIALLSVFLFFILLILTRQLLLSDRQILKRLIG
jgi:O-antigen/teichoic acid export membrane protein